MVGVDIKHRVYIATPACDDRSQAAFGFAVAHITRGQPRGAPTPNTWAVYSKDDLPYPV